MHGIVLLSVCSAMFNSIYEFFVQWLGAGTASLLLTIAAYSAIPLVFILLYALVAILGEMKISAWVQDRLGPMRTGPKGILQPIADIVNRVAALTSERGGHAGSKSLGGHAVKPHCRRTLG